MISLYNHFYSFYPFISNVFLLYFIIIVVTFSSPFNKFLLVLNAVDKNLLYPSAPSLTRYEETTIPMPRKKMVELRILDDNSTSALKQLTVSKLCIRLNTLQVSIISHMKCFCGEYLSLCFCGDKQHQ